MQNLNEAIERLVALRDRAPRGGQTPLEFVSVDGAARLMPLETRMHTDGAVRIRMESDPFPADDEDEDDDGDEDEDDVNVRATPPELSLSVILARQSQWLDQQIAQRRDRVDAVGRELAQAHGELATLRNVRLKLDELTA